MSPSWTSKMKCGAGDFGAVSERLGHRADSGECRAVRDDRMAPGAVVCYLPPGTIPTCVGSLDSVMGPPTQARLPLTDRHVTGPLKVVSWPACQ